MRIVEPEVVELDPIATVKQFQKQRNEKQKILQNEIHKRLLKKQNSINFKGRMAARQRIMTSEEPGVVESSSDEENDQNAGIDYHEEEEEDQYDLNTVGLTSKEGAGLRAVRGYASSQDVVFIRDAIDWTRIMLYHSPDNDMKFEVCGRPPVDSIPNDSPILLILYDAWIYFSVYFVAAFYRLIIELKYFLIAIITLFKYAFSGKAFTDLRIALFGYSAKDFQRQQRKVMKDREDKIISPFDPNFSDLYDGGEPDDEKTFGGFYLPNPASIKKQDSRTKFKRKASNMLDHLISTSEENFTNDLFSAVAASNAIDEPRTVTQQDLTNLRAKHELDQVERMESAFTSNIENTSSDDSENADKRREGSSATVRRAAEPTSATMLSP